MKKYEPPKKTIVVDIDGTVADTSKRTAKADIAFKEKGSRNAWFKVFRNPDLVRQDDIIPNSLESLRELEEKGYTIVYLTGRPHDMKDETRRWLRKHDFPKGRIYTSKPFANVLEEKRKVLKMLQETNHALVAGIGDWPREVLLYDEFGMRAIRVGTNRPWSKSTQRKIGRFKRIYVKPHLRRVPGTRRRVRVKGYWRRPSR